MKPPEPDELEVPGEPDDDDLLVAELELGDWARERPTHPRSRRANKSFMVIDFVSWGSDVEAVCKTKLRLCGVWCGAEKRSSANQLATLEYT